MLAAGLEEAETYILCHQNTTTQYITTRPILELSLEAERLLGEWLARKMVGSGIPRFRGCDGGSKVGGGRGRGRGGYGRGGIGRRGERMKQRFKSSN